jgi:hypothetical protein
MPVKSKTAAVTARMAALPHIPKELIDQFVTGPMSAEAINVTSVAVKKDLPTTKCVAMELDHFMRIMAIREG